MQGSQIPGIPWNTTRQRSDGYSGALAGWNFGVWTFMHIGLSLLEAFVREMSGTLKCPFCDGKVVFTLLAIPCGSLDLYIRFLLAFVFNVY